MKVGSYFSLAANIGVIVGLILVALQINQNSELLRLQMLELDSQRFVQQELAIIGEEGAKVWEKVLQSPEELTIAEQRVAEALLWPAFEAWRSSYLLHSEGLLGDEWKSRVVAQAPYYLGHAYGEAWWKNMKETVGGTDALPRELELTIDEQLISSGEQHLNYHNAIMNRLKTKSADSQK